MGIKLDFFKPTYKVNETIIVELDGLKLFIHQQDGRKNSKNFSKLGSDGQLVINPGKGIFGKGNPYIFFQYNFVFNKSFFINNFQKLKSDAMAENI